MSTSKRERWWAAHGVFSGLTVGGIVGMFGFAMIRLRYDLFIYPKS